MITLCEALRELSNKPRGSVLVEDNAGGEWLPSDLLAELESDDEGKFQLARTVTRVERNEGEIDSVIAYVSPEGFEYPHEPRWYVIRPSYSRWAGTQVS